MLLYQYGKTINLYWTGCLRKWNKRNFFICKIYVCGKIANIIYFLNRQVTFVRNHVKSSPKWYEVHLTQWLALFETSDGEQFLTNNLLDKDLFITTVYRWISSLINDNFNKAVASRTAPYD